MTGENIQIPREFTIDAIDDRVFEKKSFLPTVARRNRGYALPNDCYLLSTDHCPLTTDPISIIHTICDLHRFLFQIVIRASPQLRGASRHKIFLVAKISAGFLFPRPAWEPTYRRSASYLVGGRSASTRHEHGAAERPKMRSHAERGNERGNCAVWTSVHTTRRADYFVALKAKILSGRATRR